MEKWRAIWRRSIAPQLSTAGLTALQDGLRRDDRLLIQHATVLPTSTPATGLDRLVGAACGISYALWKGDGVTNFSELKLDFNELMGKVDASEKELFAWRYFTDWFDETPREEMRRELLAEVSLTLEHRGAITQPQEQQS